MLVTYADPGLVGNELAVDVVNVDRADPHLGKACKFFGHLVQQCPHLQQEGFSKIFHDRDVRNV